MYKVTPFYANNIINMSSRTKNHPSKRERNKTATSNGPFSFARAAWFLDLEGYAKKWHSRFTS